MTDEGYIKFRLHWTEKSLSGADFSPLIRTRNALSRQGLIGMYPDSGIGFGNVSMRDGSTARFFISGSGTGGLPVAGASDFALVTRYDIPGNRVWCEGPVRASSESLTHAMLYALSPGVGAVLHVHHAAFWRYLCGRIPTTAPQVPYGTPEMANAVRALWQHSELEATGMFAMGGHEEGLVAFGQTPGQAEAILMERYLGWRERP